METKDLYETSKPMPSKIEIKDIYEFASSLPFDLRVVFIESFIQENGPLPNEWGDKFRMLFERR